MSDPPGHRTRFSIVARSRQKTLEGRLAGTFLARSRPVAALYLGLITLSEVATVGVAFGVLERSARLAIVLHALTLVLLVTHASLVRRLNPELGRLLVALGPVPLLRIVSLTSPLAQFSYIQWFTIVAVILYSGIVTSIKLLKPDLAAIGLRWPELRHWPIEIGVIALGFVLGWIEYQILEPGPLVSRLTARELIAPILVLYVATGLLEELLFRGILQKYASDALGPWLGIALATLIFAALHAGWNSWLDIVFVGSVGLIYALVVKRTRSIVGVSISHGITNSMLFLVMPFLNQ